MRDTFLPPPRLFDSGPHGASAAAYRVHQICDAATWRSLGFGGRLKCALLALAWPLIAAGMTLPWLRQNGAAIRELSGKSVLRQWWEMLCLAVVHRISPRYYSMFELYLDERRARAGDYMLRYETKGVAYRILRPAVQTAGTPIKNKIEFARYCPQHGLPAVPMVAAFRDGVRIDGIGVVGEGGAALPESDIFAKRVLGKGGARAYRWNWVGNGRYRSGADGAEFDSAGLLAHIATLSRREAYLVQPALDNHPALRDLSLGALCTVRLLSCHDEHGGFAVTNASFRMSINPKSAVDNIHAGGIAAPVDLATGRLGPASDLGQGPEQIWHDKHPVTGAQIAGRALPYWQDALALAQRAHAVFAEWTVIGWDVAILADGARLIEGNKGPDVDLIQRPLRGPIGGGRFGALLAWNLERATR